MAPLVNLFRIGQQNLEYGRQTGGANKVNFFTTNPLQRVEGGGNVGGASNGTGEIQSNYGDFAYAGAYKGLGAGKVGEKFDTAKLGIYGF